MYSAIMDVPHYWTADQVQRLLDSLAAHNRHQARTAALIMWRTGLRVSEVIGSNGGISTTLVIPRRCSPEVEEPAGSDGADAL